MNDFENHRHPFKAMREALANDRKVNSIYAPLGEEAKNPTIAPKKDYGRKTNFSASKTVAAFAEELPNVYAWVVAKAARNNEFAMSLREFLTRNGTLTEKQITAVERAMARDAEPKEYRVNSEPDAPSVNVRQIEEAFRKAQENGIKTPKMNLGFFRFSLAPAHGKNVGAIYVKHGDIYLGKIKDGRFFKSRECDEETAAKVLEVASNPHEAAKAYGQRTGSCSVCGRTLTKHASIDAMIGPICAQKYGW